MKHCPRCQETKVNGEFNKRAVSKDGLQSYCRMCNKNRSSQFRREFKEACVDYLGAACWKCLKEFPLAAYDFHHLEPEHKDLEVSSMTFLPWDMVAEELDKCALLCACCHRVVHHEA